MNSTEKLCRFCLIHIKDTYFDDLGELCNILSALNLKVNLDICEEPVICIDCIENLRKLFSFKVICVKSEDLLVPFVNSRINKKIDLQQVYLEINDSKSLSNKKVCRFCMCEASMNSPLELNAIIEFMLPTMYLLEFFPELDINLVKDSIICKTCHNFLQDHLTFTRKCMSVEESIQKYVAMEGTNAQGKIDLKGAKQFMDPVIIKKEVEDGDTFKHENQHDEIVEDAPSKEDIKMESYIKTEDSQLENKNENTDVKSIMKSPERILDIASAESRKDYNKHFAICKGIKYPSTVTVNKYEVEECLYKTRCKRHLIRRKLIHKDPSEVTMYNCEIEGCPFETKYKTYLPIHKLIHKNPSEVTMYKCEAKGCSYKAKRKNNLNQHKLIHKDVSEVMMYKCGFKGCLYETKIKSHLTTHKLIHKNLSEVTMYKCEVEGCSYKAKRRNNLNQHKLIHKDLSEVTMHECGFERCSYKTRDKSHLARHKLRHKKLIYKHSSEVTMYKCGTEGCLYETKRKSYLTYHKLMHKDVSEVIMHKCGFEGCLFETKYKNSLLSHMLIHKNPSQVTMYKCGFGDCPYETKYKGNLIQHKLIHKDVSKVMM